jgi:hypothetical protein
MKTNDKISIVAKEFLKAFDAEELVGRKKNLIRAVDAFCFVIKNVMYKQTTLKDAASFVNREFVKNKKTFLHSDVINAVRRHNARMDEGFSGDVYYQDVYNEVIEKLINKEVINLDKHHAKVETKEG